MYNNCFIFNSVFLIRKTLFTLKFSLFIILFILAGVYCYSEESKDFEEIQDILNEYIKKSDDINLLLDVCRESINKEIPLYFIRPRISEGLAKGISTTVLAEVIRKEIHSFSQADIAIRNIPDADDFLIQDKLWQRTATLFLTGVPDNIIKKLIGINRIETERYIPLTGLYISLFRWDLPHNDVMIICESVLESSLKTGEYRDIVFLFTKARKRHIPPVKMINRMKEELPKVGSMRQLERRIFK
jgi:hypothetical protein